VINLKILFVLNQIEMKQVITSHKHTEIDLNTIHTLEFSLGVGIWKTLIIMGAWITGLWGPFHLATRTRMYFENYQLFDFICLIGAIIIAFLMIVLGRRHSYYLLVFGFIGSTISSLWGLIITPISIDGTGTHMSLLFGKISSVTGAAPLTCTWFWGFIIMGAMIQLITSDRWTFPQTPREEHIELMRIWVAIFGSLAAYLAAIVLLPRHSNAPFMAIALFSAFSLLFLGCSKPGLSRVWANHLLYHSPKSIMVEFIQIVMSQKKLDRCGEVIFHGSFILTWLIVTFGLAVGMLAFFFRVPEFNRLIEMEYMLGNLMAAVLLIIIVFFSRSWIKTSRHIGLSLGFFFLGFTINRVGNLLDFDPFALEFGLMGILLTWYFITIAIDYGRYGTAGIWITLSWLSAGYAAFIPTKIENFMAIMPALPWIIIGLMGISLLLELLRYLFVPDWHQLRDYYMHFPEAN
jgi:hypothetical protein